MVLSHVDVITADDVEVKDKRLDEGIFMEAIVGDSKLFEASFFRDANKGFFCG